MGQTMSKKFADIKGTENLSAPDAVNDIDILRKIAENERPIAMSACIELKQMEKVFWDLLGYSSTIFKKEDYICKVKISDYDFVFIFFNNVLSEDEIWLVRELRMLGKPFSLIRSKIDIYIDNAIHDGKDQEMVIPEIKGKIKNALETNPELKDTKGISLISSRKPDLGEWSDLVKCRSLIKPNFNMILCVGTTIGVYAAMVLAQSFLRLDCSNDWICDIFSYYYWSGLHIYDLLQDIKDDTVLLHEHVMKTNAGHRM